ncbi:hypothetical protein D7Z96_02335 [Pseudarthrobacter phenanthrenivorans]|jgi:hypothetical protein|uniref:Uncharacterized protein n=2 Tax=Pseudarthrobacter phenanthrenivorans TaxID=361575 RepID=A0A3B0G385_PSEPS|nr:hypothetical protein [Pseudarthrobacter phenanthrenivorans]ADX73790.1 hypothetical protein Asphe3_26700 [Pseudarthrobacter phenanthrenivorans Sphe3]RKO26645.1 hypothetical protein D7Z96_02335 [Pseudarthrobacter phenanthrenivorans]TPV52077.1 hypothetical protein FJ661_06620 [Pseudarthrobacter phenanthrenivorans]
MHQTSGTRWQITTDTSGPMMIALYVRDTAGLDGAGHPALSHAAPKVRRVDHSHLTADVGGLSALKTEWEAWWEQLLKAYPQTSPELSPPDFGAFGNSPALQRVLQAHFGSALTWARERRSEYAELEAERAATGADQLLEDMVDDRLMEVGRDSRDFRLTIIELPLNEPRAWYLEPDKIIMSNQLMGEPELFRSYVQPVVEILV